MFVCLSVGLSVGLSGLSVAAFVGIELHLCARIGRRGYGRHARAGPVTLACFENIILNPMLNSILVY